MSYLTQENVNYLVKMKTDLSHYANLEIGKYFHFSDPTKSDPFLITPSLDQKHFAQGAGIHAMYSFSFNFCSKKGKPRN